MGELKVEEPCSTGALVVAALAVVPPHPKPAASTLKASASRQNKCKEVRRRPRPAAGGPPGRGLSGGGLRGAADIFFSRLFDVVFDVF